MTAKLKKDSYVEAVIYGIFRPSSRELIKVSLIKEEIELELGLESNEEDRFVTIPIVLLLTKQDE